MRTMLMLLLLSAPALAGEKVRYHSTQDSCGIFNAAGEIESVWPCKVNITDFDGGLAKVTYQGVIQPAPAEDMLFDYASTGQTCGAGRQSTTTWYETLDTRGRAKLSCWLKRGVNE